MNLGVICYELAVGEHPFQDYPIAFPPAPNLTVGAVDTTSLTNFNFPQLFVTTVTSLLNTNIAQRMDILEAYTNFKSL